MSMEIWRHLRIRCHVKGFTKTNWILYTSKWKQSLTSPCPSEETLLFIPAAFCLQSAGFIWTWSSLCSSNPPYTCASSLIENNEALWCETTTSCNERSGLFMKALQSIWTMSSHYSTGLRHRGGLLTSWRDTGFNDGGNSWISHLFNLHEGGGTYFRRVTLEPSGDVQGHGEGACVNMGWVKMTQVVEQMNMRHNLKPWDVCSSDCSTSILHLHLLIMIILLCLKRNMCVWLIT